MLWLINRSALAPVSAAGTGANALRLIPKSNLDKARALHPILVLGFSYFVLTLLGLVLVCHWLPQLHPGTRMQLQNGQ